MELTVHTVESEYESTAVTAAEASRNCGGAIVSRKVHNDMRG